MPTDSYGARIVGRVAGMTLTVDIRMDGAHTRDDEIRQQQCVGYLRSVIAHKITLGLSGTIEQEAT